MSVFMSWLILILAIICAVEIMRVINSITPLNRYLLAISAVNKQAFNTRNNQKHPLTRRG